LAQLPSAGEAETRATLSDGTALCVLIRRAAPNAGVTLVLRTATSTLKAADTRHQEGDVP
jgi:hypothetical protein